MKLLSFSEDWLRRHLESDVEEPTGLLAVSPEIMQAAEQRAARRWDGTQEDAERLVLAVVTDNAGGVQLP